MEIQNQLGPLVAKVERLERTQRSLYSNGSGGPPGYLENARAEDKEDKRKLFSKIDEVVGRLDRVDDFITVHNTREEQRDKDRIKDAETLALKVAESDRKSNRRFALWAAALGLLMFLLTLWDHAAAVKRSLLAAPAPVSQSAPQDAGMPRNP